MMSETDEGKYDESLQLQDGRQSAFLCFFPATSQKYMISHSPLHFVLMIKQEKMQ